ncbi:MAG TPA: hypothetical protein DEA08_03060 [Planctomycetes bacterium]|nr:hypothetical protein [Planctomycetota bacterium]
MSPATATHDRHLLEPLEFARLLMGYEDGFLCTRSTTSDLSARPMRLVDVSPTCELIFVSKVDGKVEEIRQHPNVCVTFRKRGRFASVSGRAFLESDPDTLAHYQVERLTPWLPQRGDDEQLVVIRVTPHTAESWDSTGLVHRLRRLAAIGEAIVRGQTAEHEAYDHVELES